MGGTRQRACLAQHLAQVEIAVILDAAMGQTVFGESLDGDIARFAQPGWARQAIARCGMAGHETGFNLQTLWCGSGHGYAASVLISA